MIVAIDSNIVIYAGHAPRDAGSNEGEAEDELLKQLRQSAKIVLYRHQEDTIVFPTVAIAIVMEAPELPTSIPDNLYSDEILEEL